MLSVIKNAYCFYIVQIILHCDNEYELNRILDRVIDNNLVEQFVSGDEDIKEVFKYVCEYRRYNRCIRDTKPEISGNCVIKAVSKSIF